MKKRDAAALVLRTMARYSAEFVVEMIAVDPRSEWSPEDYAVIEQQANVLAASLAKQADALEGMGG